MLIEIWSHKWSIEGNNHFPQTVACTLANMAQYVVHLMCHKGTLPCFPFSVHQDPLILFCKAFSQSVAVRITLSQRQETFYFSSLNFMRFQLAHSSSLLKSGQTATLPSSTSTAPVNVHCSVFGSPQRPISMGNFHILVLLNILTFGI